MARPSDSVSLLLPSGYTLFLCLSGSTAAFRIPASASVTRAICSALALHILPVSMDHQLSISTSGSNTTCSTTVGQPPGVISPSSTMAVSHLAPPTPSPSCLYPGSSLNFRHLGSRCVRLEAAHNDQCMTSKYRESCSKA